MVETSVTVINAKGIHVRPSGIIFKTIMGYDGEIIVDKGGFKTPIRDIISILTLGLVKGSTITISVNGPNEEEMLATLADLFGKCYKFAET